QAGHRLRVSAASEAVAHVEATVERAAAVAPVHVVELGGLADLDDADRIAAGVGRGDRRVALAAQHAAGVLSVRRCARDLALVGGLGRDGLDHAAGLPAVHVAPALVAVLVGLGCGRATALVVRAVEAATAGPAALGPAAIPTRSATTAVAAAGRHQQDETQARPKDGGAHPRSHHRGLLTERSRAGPRSPASRARTLGS